MNLEWRKMAIAWWADHNGYMCSVEEPHLYENVWPWNIWEGIWLKASGWHESLEQSQAKVAEVLETFP